MTKWFGFISWYLFEQLFHNNYEVISKMYHEAMKKLFKQIPTNKPKPFSHDKKPVAIGRHWRCVVLDTLGSLRLFFVNMKTKIFLTGRG